MATVGGVVVTSYEFTQAWGVNPASAQGSTVVDPGLDVGDYVAFSFGSIVFYGIVSHVRLKKSATSGDRYVFDLVDNRIRLHWATVFGQWNMEEDPHGERGRLVPGADADQWAHAPVLPGDGTEPADMLEGEGLSVSAVEPVGTLSDAGPRPKEGRRFYHVLPTQWGAQIRTWTDAPMTAREVLSSAFNGAESSFGFARNYHTAQSTAVVVGVDYNEGGSLANLVADLTEPLGLAVRLSGARTLVWGRKGSAAFTPPPLSAGGAPGAHLDSAGLAMERRPTKIRLVGDPNLVQVNNVVLEPDWAPGWEEFVSEAAWLENVGLVFGLDGPDDLAERAAKAREVTLAQYLEAIQVEGEWSATEDYFQDFGRHGALSRMDLPVWVYVQEFVYRSYRIPVGFDLYGVPLDSLEIEEGLLAAVELHGTGATTKIRYRREPVELYPDATAFVAAKGQPLDLLDSRNYELFGRARSKDLREEWSSLPEFEVDHWTKGIRFRTPVFLDGDPVEEKSILLYPNRGQGGYADVSTELENTDFLSVVIPNPDFEIAPAAVKASFVFRLGRFHRDYGTGPRRGAVPARGVAHHLLDVGDDANYEVPSKLAPLQTVLSVPDEIPAAQLAEILWEDGSGAEAKADVIAASVLERESVLESGVYVRRGVAGYGLHEAVDRVTVRVTQEEGVVERIELVKERPTEGFVAEVDLQERQQARELYPGQVALRREVERIRRQGEMKKEEKADAARAVRHRQMADIFRVPAGGSGTEVQVVTDDRAAEAGAVEVAEGPKVDWRAGHAVWADAAGKVDAAGQRFRGVVVAAHKVGGEQSAEKEAVMHTAVGGTVPVLVQGPFSVGAMVGCDPGENVAKEGGERYVGVVDHTAPYAGEDQVMAMVRVGVLNEEPGRRPFEPHSLQSAPVEAGQDPAWRVKVARGYVVDAHVLNEGHPGPLLQSAVRLHRPIVGYGPDPESGPDEVPIYLDSDPAPFVDVPAVESWGYVHYKTSYEGNLKVLDEQNPNSEFVEVVAFDEEMDSRHFQPVDEFGANGVEGDFYVPIFKTVSNGLAGELEAPKIVHYRGHQSNIYAVDPFDSNKNIGVGGNWWKRYDPEDGKHEFRRGKGGYAIEVETRANELVFRLRAENLGEEGVPVYVQPPDNPAPGDDDRGQFYKIAPGESPRNEIEVYLDKDPGDPNDPGVIRVRGNNRQGKIAIQDGVNPEVVLSQWRDGLQVVDANTVLQVVRVMVCQDGVPVEKKFLAAP